MVTWKEDQNEGLCCLPCWNSLAERNKDLCKGFSEITGVRSTIALTHTHSPPSDSHPATVQTRGAGRERSLQTGSHHTCRRMTVCILEICPYGCNSQAPAPFATSNLHARRVAHTHQHADRDHNSNTHTAKWTSEFCCSSQPPPLRRFNAEINPDGKRL